MTSCPVPDTAATGNRQTESVLTDPKSLPRVDPVNTSRVTLETSGIGHVD